MYIVFAFPLPLGFLCPLGFACPLIVGLSFAGAVAAILLGLQIEDEPAALEDAEPAVPEGSAPVEPEYGEPVAPERDAPAAPEDDESVAPEGDAPVAGLGCWLWVQSSTGSQLANIAKKTTTR